MIKTFINLTLLSILTTASNAALINDAYNEQSKGNFVKASKLYEKACNQNDYASCTRLAYMNRNGTGIEINKQKAVKLYTKVCKKTNNNCSTLAWMYHEGEGVRQNKQKFFQLSKQACDNDDYTGCQFIGYSYRDGNIIRQNKTLALEIFTSMCNMQTYTEDNKQIARQSCLDAGFIYYNNGKASHSKIQLAKEYFGKGCDLGNNEACKDYKILNEQGF